MQLVFERYVLNLQSNKLLYYSLKALYLKTLYYYLNCNQHNELSLKLLTFNDSLEVNKVFKNKNIRYFKSIIESPNNFDFILQKEKLLSEIRVEISNEVSNIQNSKLKYRRFVKKIYFR